MDTKKKGQEKEKDEDKRNSDVIKKDAIDQEKTPSNAENYHEKEPNIASYINGTKNEAGLDKRIVKEEALSEQIDIKAVNSASEKEEVIEPQKQKKNEEAG